MIVTTEAPERCLKQAAQQAKFVPSSIPGRCSTSDKPHRAALFVRPQEPSPGTKRAYEKTSSRPDTMYGMFVFSPRESPCSHAARGGQTSDCIAAKLVIAGYRPLEASQTLAHRFRGDLASRFKPQWQALECRCHLYLENGGTNGSETRCDPPTLTVRPHYAGKRPRGCRRSRFHLLISSPLCSRHRFIEKNLWIAGS